MRTTHFRPTRLLPLLLLLLWAGAAPGDAQHKPALDHADTYGWNDIEDEGLSADGRWLAYVLEPYEGDETLVVRDLESGAELRIERGVDPAFSPGGPHLVFRIEAAEAAVDSARDEGASDDDASDDDLPADTLGVLDLEASFRGGTATPIVTRTGGLKSFELPEDEGRALAALFRADAEANEGEAGEEEEEEEEADDPEHEKPEGSPLELRLLGGDGSWRFENVTGYALSDDGSRLVYAAHSEDGSADGAFAVETASGASVALASGPGIYDRLAVSDDGSRAAFLTNRDDWEAEDPAWALYVAEDAAAGSARMAVDATTPGVPDGWWPAEDGDVDFSDSGERVFFATLPRPPEGPTYADTVPDHKEVSVDVWNWKDDYLQPMQKVRLEEDGAPTYRAVLHLGDDRVVQLADEELPEVEVGRDGDADVALGTTDIPYRKLLSWDGRYKDAYVVDVNTGERRRVAEKVRGFSPFDLSPEARWIHWWDGEAREWFAAPTDGGEAVSLTASLPRPVHDLEDDRPEPPGPYGAAGWTEGDEAFLVYDRTDIWLVDPTDPSSPRSVTEEVGHERNVSFRHVDLDPDTDAVPTDEDVLLSGFHEAEKTHGIYRDRFEGDEAPALLRGGDDHWYGVREKADDADVVLFSRESFEEFPDLRVATTDFDEVEVVSDANPQQDDFRWGTAELVEWYSADGTRLQGTLYKPEGFDPSRKYPMMVYFYERMSDRIHRYRDPAPGSSSIAFPFYVSRGYLLFVPDIPYEVPYPGESALDAVVPGVQSIARRGFVDRDRIGVQGHSWGGYQIAYMITKTDLFAAAEAGAPVVNMTSAYGGIRWGSGMSRMFQYERTQSRIGESLWQATQEYIDNSPLFYAPKIKTPVMYIHNDDDGAVPWYQGIEFFVALRRLAKPAWMLNYNGEKHGLRQTHNQKDFAVRMQQFFDHYLKDAPAPVWMVEGVPATKKGKTLGLELVGGTATEEGGSP